LNGVGARRLDAESGFAYAALAIARHGARIVRGTLRAIGSTAIQAGFFAIDGAIGATWNGTHTSHADAASTLRSERAGFPVGARKTRATAIDVSFTGIFCGIGAFGANALVHLANECTRTALYAIDTRYARTIAIAIPWHTSELRTECPLRNRIMGQDAIGASVGCAFLGVVIGIIGRRNDDVERGVALFFFAIAIELRRQGRAGSLQSLAAAFTIGAFRFATEVGRTVVFAIGDGRAFGRQPAAAAGPATSTASPITTRAGISAASR
jgi:hypothetical protein